MSSVNRRSRGVELMTSGGTTGCTHCSNAAAAFSRVASAKCLPMSWILQQQGRHHRGPLPACAGPPASLLASPHSLCTHHQPGLQTLYPHCMEPKILKTSCLSPCHHSPNRHAILLLHPAGRQHQGRQARQTSSLQAKTSTACRGW